MSASNSIAIVGIGGIFPASPNLDGFWRNILGGINTSREVPKGRWPVDVDDAYSTQKGAPDKAYSKRACFVDDFKLETRGLDIDGAFLAELDPLFHLALHAGRNAFLDCKTDKLDKNRAKVIIGNIVLPSHESSKLAAEYLGKSFDEELEKNVGHKLFNSRNNTEPVSRFVAGLPGGVLAKALGFGSGSYTLDAACASSLYAISMAMDELLSGRIDAALAGGVSRPDCFYTQMGFSQLRALSPNGVSAPFDKAGNGLVVGEGAGMFMLKRLEDAIEAGDNIYCCVKSVGLSNDVDGSLLAPNSEGQLRAMRQAYQVAGWSPADLDLIECHGTGAPVGDAIELQSLKELWGGNGWEKGQCVIGSVKSNIGHLLTAAGSAALMKVVLSLKENVLPPTANIKTPRPDIDFENSPFRLLTNHETWQRRDPSTPRKAGVSAFGFGGINAHLLVEEWVPESTKTADIKCFTPMPAKPLDIAITGMDAHFGPWETIAEFKNRVLGDADAKEPVSNNNWRGARDCEWFKRAGMTANSFKGFYINELQMPLDKFRIPPMELEDILPQQLLMLKVAAGAIEAGRLSEDDRLKTAVIVGIGLDLNTTNFHFRWIIREKAKELAKNAGLDISGNEFEELVQTLMESAGPALTASRTLGALGGVVASRVSREFRLGGPGFTVSNEECSGVCAIETACRLMQTGKIKQAVVGAVDLAGDIRAVLSTHANRPYSSAGLPKPFDQGSDGSIPSDGAAAIVLKPLNDAIKSGDTIYSVIKGIGSATSGDPAKHIPSITGYKKALETAYGETGFKMESVDLIEANGSGLPEEDKMEFQALLEADNDLNTGNKAENSCAISSVKADIGHSGAAAGMASVVKAALCLYHNVMPGLRNFKNPHNEFTNIQNRFCFPQNARLWLRNKVDGPRRAGVSSISMDGNCSHLVLEEFKNTYVKGSSRKHCAADSCLDNIFIIEFDTASDLKGDIKRLQNHIRLNESGSTKTTAASWWKQNRHAFDKKLALTLLVSDHEELNNYLDKAYDIDSNNGLENLNTIDENRVFFSADPVGPQGEIAFVYPGSGNHYPDMGRDLLMQWPEIVDLMDETSSYLKAQFASELFWAGKSAAYINNDKRGALLAQVTIGCFITDLLESFRIKPQAAIGYSLGESASLLSLKVWRDRDEMMRRIMTSSLFTDDLAGRFNAARAAWGLAGDEEAKWTLGLLLCPEDEARKALENRDRVYLLIVNTHKECVIGGDEDSVNRFVSELGRKFIPLDGVTIAHCEIVKSVAEAYRNFHLFDVDASVDVRFYSGSWGASYALSSENAADSVAAHAVNGFNFPRLVDNAYNDGVRVFIEIGPGSSCSRMINSILKGRSHIAIPANNAKQNEVTTMLKLLARLISERVHVDLGFIYDRAGSDIDAREVAGNNIERTIAIPVGGKPFKIHESLKVRLKRNEIFMENRLVEEQTSIKGKQVVELNEMQGHESIIQSMREANKATMNAHEQFLSFAGNIEQTMAGNIEFQLSLLEAMPASDVEQSVFQDDLPETVDEIDNIDNNEGEAVKAAFDRDKCMEFAVGKIASVLGESFAEVDNHPTRVRLPDEPMMFVDRILLVEGEPLSLKSGRVVTEHDVKPGAWYLDCNRIPTCVAVEAGQADLFLSGYLGIDFKTKGLAMYRLLDAVVTFHSELPEPGQVIKYDIHIDNFFKHGETYLFRFNFEATVNGRPLLSMKDGCAGFFTQLALDEGKGIIEQDMGDGEAAASSNRLPEIVPMQIESYTENQINELRAGNLAACFGELFEGLDIRKPSVIPGGMMRLVHRITKIDPNGGAFGLGFVQGEADIHKDDWFIVCHFVDDKVMPGTLMYECCLHTLRVYLLRMGWVAEEDEAVYQPVPGVASRLKCRGQVLETTKLVTYEISIKEIGYRPEPYVICDALMYADSKAIVKIEDMSLRISGLTREKIDSIWAKQSPQKIETRKAIFDTDRILAFAIGKPSEAFGKPYEIFDNDRKIARLPGPPYQFLDRIVELDAEPWKMVGGGQVTAEYDVPVDAWYFAENQQAIMPFAVLLEVALQPCGWLAAYVGSALTSDIDLCFRNLGGNAIISKPVYCDIGTLATTVKMTRVSQSGGMIIQHYDFHVTNNGQTVYKGDTYFGFFTKAALADQIGIRDAKIYKPTESEQASGQRFDYPRESPYPLEMMRMLDRIDLFVNDGGPKGLGLIQGSKIVNPEEWFFKAHFYQDPVCPGSLGLESFLQLLKVAACNRWGVGQSAQLEAVASKEKHSWIYRGQVIPKDEKVIVEAVVTHVDDEQRLLKADGFLTVDGRVIYQMTDFTIRVIL